MDQKQTITTQVIEDIVNKTSSDRILVRDLVDSMDALGFGLAMMVFAFAVIIPLPPPLPSIIAIPLVIFSFQMVLGYSAPKLPKTFSNLTVKRSIVAMLVQKSAPYIRKIESVLRPRLSFMTSKIAERIVGLFTLIFSIFVVIPLPLSNFIPGLGILIIAFGLLGKDGLIVILGIIIGVVGAAVSVATILLGVEMIYYIKSFF